MESRLLAIRGGLGALFFNGSYRRNFMRQGVAVIHTQIPADPAIHSGVPDEAEVEAAEKAKTEEAQRVYKPPVDTGPFVPPKPPVSFSSKLENILNNPPINPTTQQKRHVTIITSTGPPPLADVACDGTPEEEAKRERRRERREQEEDDKEYFKHHKASPLAEIEVADTRKPISRATDGTADSYGGGKNEVLFSDEQRDSAEDSLRRATEMWREAAVRGDPDSPHGRVLRALRGENW